MESLLAKAKEMEKKYEWLQAAEYYKQISHLMLDTQDFLQAAEFKEKMGFCFYRAAFQANTNIEFRKRLKQVIIIYEEESVFIKRLNEKNNNLKLLHIEALISYVRSWLEKSSMKKRKLLAKWWTLENKVLEGFEQIGNKISIGKTCVDLLEYSNYNWFWLSENSQEHQKKLKAGFDLSEKAIQTLSKLTDEYELARAYCFASWYYGWSYAYNTSQDKIIELLQKSQEYSKKALELSQKIEDSWLISWSYQAAWSAMEWYNKNPDQARNYGKKVLDYGKITKDKNRIGFGNALTSYSIVHLAWMLEDPDKQKESFMKAIIFAKEANDNFLIIQYIPGFSVSIGHYSLALRGLASIETNLQEKQAIIERANNVIQDGINRIYDWENIYYILSYILNLNLRLLSEIKPEQKEKKNHLEKAKSYIVVYLNHMVEVYSYAYLDLSKNYYDLASIQNDLAKIESTNRGKIELLINASTSIEKAIKLAEKRRKLMQSPWASGYYFGRYYKELGEINQQIYFLTKKENNLFKAINAFENAVKSYNKADLPTNIAESYWHLAQLYDQRNDFKNACKNYELSADSFRIAAKKIPQFNQFYKDYSSYMLGWSQIEQARSAHSLEEYSKAKENYEKAAKLHKSTDSWSYLASNYSAWASMEEAEGLSRKENTQHAKETFQKALKKFVIAEKSFKHKIGEVISEEEKSLNQKLLQASALRRKFCQARIQIEEAKLLDSGGKYLQSSQSYGEAAQNILSIVQEVESEVERNELEYVAILCQAWGKMATAEETASAESYLEASKLFEQAKEHCYTRKASLWALGNSSFCKGLAAGINYQNNVDVSEHARAKSLMKSAETNYLQAGFNLASEYAKASQRLLDAYLYMNSAETETVQDERAKQYQLAEKLLQMAAGSFMKAKHPEKATQLQKILANVREEKALAVSLSQVMKAPTIASSTMSFTAPSPTNEVSVGLEQFQHANVQANLFVGLKEVRIGESFCLSVEFVNAGREPALLTRVEDFVPPDFMVVKKPEIYRLEDSCLNMKGKQIAPLKLVEVKLILQPSRKGVYQLNPKVHYLDENGQSKSLQLKAIDIKVEEVILSDRISTGTKELDSLLLGGIPKEYAVVLTGSPSDEREQVITNFLQTREGETSFYVATEATGLENLLQKPNFYLFLCNPKPKIKVADSPNIYKLHGKADINNLNIALLRAYRTIDQSSNKKMCLNIVSDVLANYTIRTARQWIAELTTDLISKGFIVLAVINPLVHTPEELNNLLELFDGEISLTQTEDPLECRKSLRIKKLRNQDYIKNPICLAKS